MGTNSCQFYFQLLLGLQFWDFDLGCCSEKGFQVFIYILEILSQFQFWHCILLGLG